MTHEQSLLEIAREVASTARAGEQGRGFAVVASEVRSLAQRSSQAAKDIKDLIVNSNSQVKDGVDLVNQAGTALGEIVESIKQVAAIVSDIANASIEQSTGIEQVNKAIMQMDQMTQQNAALVEEAAGTSASMAQLARDLQVVVSKFKLDQSFVQAVVEPAARPAAQRAAVTGTYGGGARGSRPTGAKSPSRLHIVSHDTRPATDKKSADDDFESF